MMLKDLYQGAGFAGPQLSQQGTNQIFGKTEMPTESAKALRTVNKGVREVKTLR